MTERIEVDFKPGQGPADYSGQPVQFLTFEGPDLAAKWEEVSDLPGVQYAAYWTPKRSGNGMRLRGYMGEPAAEREARMAREAADREERDRLAEERMIAGRTWEWNGFRDSLGYRPPS